MKRLLGILLLATSGTVCLLTSAGSASEGLRVLRSDEESLVLEWTWDRDDLARVTGSDGEYRTPVCEGGARLAEPGAPDVPSLVRLMAIPPGGLPRVSVTSVTTVRTALPDMAPAPHEKLVERESGIPQFVPERTRDEAFFRPGLYPGSWAELGGVSSVRGLRVARLVVHPWRYDSARRELVRAERLVVRVDFPGGDGRQGESSARGSGGIERHLLADALLNPRAADRWQRPRADLRSGSRSPDSFASGPTWLKIPIQQTGLYQIDYLTFANAGFDPGAIDPATVRVFSGTNLPLAEDLQVPRADFMQECALCELGNGDGHFDLSDRFVFYALGPHGWAAQYDSTRSRTEYAENPYDDKTVYWLTWGEVPGHPFSAPARRMNQRSVAPNPGAPSFATQAPYRIHFEQNNIENFRYRDEDGWMWESLRGRGQNRSYYLRLDDVADGNGTVLGRFYTFEGDSTRPYRDIRLKVGGVVIDSTGVGYHTNYRAAWTLEGSVNGALTSGSNRIIVDAASNDSTLDNVYVAWFDIEYTRRLEAVGDGYLQIFSDHSLGVSDYLLSGFDGNPGEILLLDVTDPHEVVWLTDFTLTEASAPHGIRFSEFGSGGLPAGSAGVRSYVASTLAGVHTLPMPEVAEIRGLRSTALGAEYVAIYHPRFEDGAHRLVEEIHGQLNPASPVAIAVDLDDVYDEFSWGLRDPMAIRDFIKYALENWQGAGGKPAFVTLVGDAAYDLKQTLSGSPENLVPTYINRYQQASEDYAGTHSIYFYPTDDFFGYLEEEDFSSAAALYGPGLDVAIGRLPVSKTEDLDVLLDKLESYYRYDSPGQWQNRMILVADDEVSPSSDWEQAHTDQIEELAQTYVPPAIDPVKIYLTEYPRNSFGKKPEAQADLIEEFTRGALMVAYAGHGDQNTLAQEEVFVSQKVPELLNEDRTAIFSTFSCSVSRFDLLSGNSMTELILLQEGGGAVTTVGSGGLAYSIPSRDLNNAWLSAIFGTPYLVDTYSRDVRTVGISLMYAKTVSSGSSAGWWRNQEKYVLLGDSALTPRYAHYLIRFNKPTVDENLVDGLLRVIRGTVVDSAGSVLDGSTGVPAFNGKGYVYVTEDADTSGYVRDATHVIPYTLPGPIAFRGEVTITNGRFETKFYVPESVPAGNMSRVSVFALETELSRHGSGACDTLVLAPTISADQVDDSEGPSIQISFEGYENFTDGDMIFTDRPILRVWASDESGVNLRPFPQFARFQAELDGEERVNLEEDFSYLTNSFTQGVVRRVLPLSEGDHTIRVKAFDNVGNRGEETIRVTVVVEGTVFGIVDDRVAVYPNPFLKETDIVYRLTHPAEVTLKIFTINGRRIYESHFYGSNGDNSIHWLARDQKGQKLANGTYLYKLEARFTDEGRTATDEYVGHLVKLR
jgi:hypothetical protein